jgi:hypothetical protein
VPVIDVLGHELMTLEASSGNYVDDSATCSDQLDGLISENIQTSGQVVDLSSPSEYTLLYHCTNAHGATAVAKTRTIWVMAAPTAVPPTAPTEYPTDHPTAVPTDLAVADPDPST